jgi:AcrR family transcriptional regulator
VTLATLLERMTEEPREGLRERKKSRTRETPAANAQRMFRERGFDQVTVAEIAEASDVSVKTLFVYFDSNEDLVFADEFSLLDQIDRRLAAGPVGTSPAEAVRLLAHDLIDGTLPGDDTEGIVAFARLIGENPALHSRLQLMWERYEQRLAATLAAETGGSPLDPATRAAAALLITPPRVLTSSDVRRRIPDDGAATWIDTCFALIEKGLPG